MSKANLLKKYKEEPKKNIKRNQKEELIKEYAPLIKFVAQKIAVRLPPNIELDDLISAGSIGLMDAIENSGMIYTIRVNVYEAVVHFTYDMAVVKFSLLLIVVLFILVAVLMWVIVHFEKATRKST